MGGHLAGEPHLVRDHDHCSPLGCQFLHQAQHIADQFRVERRSRFIKQQGVGLHRQRAGNRHPLLLPAGKLVWIIIAPLIQPDLVQQRRRAFHRLGLRHLQHLGRRLNQVLHHAHVLPQIEILEHHRQFRAHPLNLAQTACLAATVALLLDLHHLAGDTHLAPVRHLQKIQTTQKRTLARPGRAENRDHIALVRGQGNPFQHLDIAKGLMNINRLQRRNSIHRKLPKRKKAILHQRRNGKPIKWRCLIHPETP